MSSGNNSALHLVKIRKNDAQMWHVEKLFSGKKGVIMFDVREVEQPNNKKIHPCHPITKAMFFRSSLFSFGYVLTEQFLQRNVPLRHLLNEETLFMS